jgi:hypothetical protein
MHAPKVMKDLFYHCDKAISADVNNPLCANIKMVMMAIQAIGSKPLDC